MESCPSLDKAVLFGRCCRLNCVWLFFCLTLSPLVPSLCTFVYQRLSLPPVWRPGSADSSQMSARPRTNASQRVLWPTGLMGSTYSIKYHTDEVCFSVFLWGGWGGGGVATVSLMGFWCWLWVGGGTKERIKKKNEDETKDFGSRIRGKSCCACTQGCFLHAHTCHHEMFSFWSLIQMVLVWDSCENEIHNPAEKLGWICGLQSFAALLVWLYKNYKDLFVFRWNRPVKIPLRCFKLL